MKKGIVDLDNSTLKNIKNLAEHKNTTPENLTACILDRPRHKQIIEELISLKVKIKLISDGDVSGALLVTNEKYNVDIFLGIGGGPEGVLAASALDAYNCFFQGKFIFDNENDKPELKKWVLMILKKNMNLMK
jgi:fructose-1,6-bisphosphatase II / sedoheptulose-1,7-bisphosphatase